jgi:tetratricopeptide (TPR) repeat protein
MKTDAEKAKCRARAARNRRALLNERKKFGSYDDGGGKRYLIGVDYVAAGETEKAIEYFRWFDREFSDDVGEPAFLLHWALAEFRAGNPQEASRRLKIAMISNPYMLALLAGQPQSQHPIWHGSNWELPEYLAQIDGQLAEPSDEECGWISNEFQSAPFQTLLSEFLAVRQALLDEHDHDRRGRLLDRWRKFQATHVGKATT